MLAVNSVQLVCVPIGITSSSKWSCPEFYNNHITYIIHINDIMTFRVMVTAASFSRRVNILHWLQKDLMFSVQIAAFLMFGHIGVLEVWWGTIKTLVILDDGFSRPDFRKAAVCPSFPPMMSSFWLCGRCTNNLPLLCLHFIWVKSELILWQ